MQIISKKITGVYNVGSNNGFSKDKFIKEIIGKQIQNRTTKKNNERQ